MVFPKSKSQEINGLNFKFSDEEIFADFEKEVKFGLMSDIHNQVDKAKEISLLFKQRGVDGIIIAGDINLSPFFRYNRKIEEFNQIFNVLNVVSNNKMPVFVIPGNHESKKEYDSAIRKLKNQNVIDMVKYRSVDLKEIQIVSLPGYQFENFVAPDGYFSDSLFVKRTSKYVKNKTTLLVSHGPPKIKGSLTPGMIYSGRDVGDENITRLIKQCGIKFVVSGHIHEAAGIAVDFKGKPLQQNKWTDELALNIGTLEEWE
ncbi:MAG: metallophosphoesterase, partial [Candidatus Aenigmatarchaeota archaeon]